MEREFNVSAVDPDWTREKKPFFAWSPSHSLIASVRAYQRAANRKGALGKLLRAFATIRHRLWQTVTGADLPATVMVQGGLMLPHPNGVVVHPESQIGPNCLLFQQVTLAIGRGGAPRLGGHVEVGAGAKIIGGVSIGDHAVIGANAVVISDVPAGATAVGVPARIVRVSSSNTGVPSPSEHLRSSAS